MNKRIIISSGEEMLKQGRDLRGCVIQGIDFEGLAIDWKSLDAGGAIFLGCRFPDCEIENELRRRGTLIFPRIEEFPYRPFRFSLYTWKELMEGYDWETLEDRSLDSRVYEHITATGSTPVDIIEALARRIHDFSIDSALSELLSGHPRVAGIMGGHSMRRTDAFYRKVARLGQLLGKADYFVVTGGGPGVMEAGNLGAYMGAYSADDLEEALDILAGAPAPGTGEYQLRARQVVQRFPRGRENLAIPTWFYPYEPTNLFASHIAKYFSNSIREDGLMAICIHGVVYCPGSAGTIQEIFMDASQNHYGTFNFYSPMVFFGSEGYERQKNLYSMLREVAEGKYYQKLIFMSDDPVEIVEIIRSHPPVPVDGAQ